MMNDLKSSNQSFKKLCIIISGQSDFGAEVIRSVNDKGHRIVFFVCTSCSASYPDISEKVAADLGIPFVRASALDKELVLSLSHIDADIGLMAYVTIKAEQSFLEFPRHGTIQYHPSLLPKYRGPSAINWAIINGEKRTGFTIFSPNQILDDGDILFQKEFDILEHESAGGLYRRVLLPEGVKALVDCSEMLVAGRTRKMPQYENLATYQGWCTKRFARINWHNCAYQINNLIRGCDPKPGAWMKYKGKDIVICRSKVSLVKWEGCENFVYGQIVDIGKDRVTIKCGSGFIDFFEYRDESGARRKIDSLVDSNNLIAGICLS